MPSVQHDPVKQVSRVNLSLTDFSNIYSLNLDSPAHSDPEYQTIVRFRDDFGHGSKWYGGIKSQAEAEEIMVKGWQEGLNKLSAIKDMFADSGLGTKTRRRVGTWADQGDTLNVDRALNGQWESAWRTSKRKMAAGVSHIDLVADWGGACFLSAEQLFWKGAALAVCADILEEAGYCTRIVAVHPFYNHHNGRDTGNYGCTAIAVKDYSDPLNLDGIASVICHAGIYRTFGFKALLAQPVNVTHSMAFNPGFEAAFATVKGRGSDMWADLEEGLVIKNVSDKQTALNAIKRVIHAVQGAQE